MFISMGIKLLRSCIHDKNNNAGNLAFKFSFLFQTKSFSGNISIHVPTDSKHSTSFVEMLRTKKIKRARARFHSRQTKSNALSTRV